MLLKLLHEVWMLDVDVFWFLLEDWGRAFLKESNMGCDDILHECGLYFFLEHNFVLDVLSHGEAGEGLLGVEDLFLDERLINLREFSAWRKGNGTFDDSFDSGVGLCDFPQFHCEVDEMGDEAFPGLVDGSSSLDLLVFLDFLTDEVEEEVVLENGRIEGGCFSFSKCNLNDLDDLVVQQIVQRIFSEEVDEDGEEAVRLSHDFASVDDVLLQHEPQDLDDLYPSSS